MHTIFHKEADTTRRTSIFGPSQPTQTNDADRARNAFVQAGGDLAALRKGEFTPDTKDPTSIALWTIGGPDRQILWNYYGHDPSSLSHTESIMHNAFGGPRVPSAPGSALYQYSGTGHHDYGEIAKGVGKGFARETSAFFSAFTRPFGGSADNHLFPRYDPNTGAQYPAGITALSSGIELGATQMLKPTFEQLGWRSPLNTAVEGTRGAEDASKVIPRGHVNHEAFSAGVIMGSILFPPVFGKPFEEISHGDWAWTALEVATLGGAALVLKGVGRIGRIPTIGGGGAQDYSRFVKEMPFVGRAGSVTLPDLGGVAGFADDIAAATHPTVLREFVGKNPALSAVARVVSGSNVTAKSTSSRYEIGRGMQIYRGEQQAGATVRMIGDGQEFHRIFPDFDVSQGTFTKGVNFGKRLDDATLRLSPEGRRWVDDHDAAMSQMRGKLEDAGILGVMDKAADTAGLFSASPRAAIAILRGVGKSPDEFSVVGGDRLPTIQKALDDGWEILTPDEALFHKLSRGYRGLANNNAAHWVQKELGLTRSNLPEWKLRIAYVGDRLEALRELAEDGIFKVLQEGGEPSRRTINSLRSQFPELNVAADLFEQTRYKPEDFLNVIGKDGPIKRRHSKKFGDTIDFRPLSPVEIAHSRRTIGRRRAKLDAAVARYHGRGGKTQVNAHAVIIAARNLSEATRAATFSAKGRILKRDLPSIKEAFTFRRLKVVEDLKLQVLGRMKYRQTGLKDGVPKFTTSRPAFGKGGASGALTRNLKEIKAEFSDLTAGRKQTTRDFLGREVPDADDLNHIGELLFKTPKGVEFLDELADLRKLDDAGSVMRTLRAVSTVNGLIRMINLGMDGSVLFIQLLGFAFNHPLLFARASGRAFQSIFDSTVLNKLMLRHSDTVAKSKNLLFASHGGADYTEVLKPGGLLYGKSKPVRAVRAILRPWERFFDTGLDYSGLLLRESLVDDAVMSAKEIYDTERFINLFRGMTNRQLSGVSKTQSLWEGLSLLAPRYMAASVSLLSDLARGGKSGELARRKLGQLAGGTVMAFAAMDFFSTMKQGADAGRSPEDTLNAWVKSLGDKFNPNSHRFMKAQVGGMLVGFNPKAISFIKMFAGIWEDPSSILDRGRSNPVLRLINYNMSKTASSIPALVSGRNAIGEPVYGGRLGMGNFFKNFVAGSFPPIWVGTAFTSEGDLSDRLAMAGADFVGVGSRPLSLGDSLDRLISNVWVDKTGNLVNQDSEDRVFRWDDLEPAARGQFNATDEVRSIRARFDKQNQHSILQDLRDDAVDQQMASDGDLGAATLNPKVWQNKFFKTQTRLRGRSDVVEALGVYENRDDFSGEEEEVLNEYWDLLSRLDDAGADTDEFVESIEMFTLDLERRNPELAAFLERNSAPNATPTVRKFREMFDTKRKLGWYRSHTENPAWSQLPPSVRGSYELYLKSRMNGESDQWLRQNPGMFGIVNSLGDWTRDHREKLRIDNPEMDGMVVYWNNQTAKTSAGIAEAVKLARSVSAISGRSWEGAEISFMVTQTGKKIDPHVQGLLIHAGFDTIEDLASLGSNSELMEILRGVQGIAEKPDTSPASLKDFMRWDIVGVAKSVLAHLT